MRHPSKWSVLAAGAALIVGVWAVSSDAQSSQKDDAVALLLDRISMLEDRVERLEYFAMGEAQALDAQALEAGGGDEADGDAPVGVDLSAALGGRYMRVDALEPSEHVEDHSEEIDRLRREVQSLERQLMNEEKSLARIQGSTGRNDRSTSRRHAQQRVVNQYRKALSLKDRELKQLEATHGAPKQIIQGRAKDKIITLHTDRDLSRSLSEVSGGDFVTWRGRLVEMTTDTESWVVDGLRKLPQE
jgi:hypothetical protein